MRPGFAMTVDAMHRLQGVVGNNTLQRVLAGCRVEDSRIQRFAADVDVRVWLITVDYEDGSETVTSGDVDHTAIQKNVRSIWAKADIGLHFGEPVRVTIKLPKPPSAYDSGDDFRSDVNKVLAPLVNGKAKENRESDRQVVNSVLVPAYDRWGFTYSPLAGGDGIGPYDEPVTIVTTGTAGFGEETQPRESDVVLTGVDGYEPTGVVLDAAHELGHAFGLEHVQGPENVHLLMHGSLYHAIANADKMKQSDAVGLATRQFGGKEAFVLARQPKAGKADGRFWVVLHEADVSETDAQLAIRNIREGKVSPSE